MKPVLAKWSVSEAKAIGLSLECEENWFHIHDGVLDLAPEY